MTLPVSKLCDGHSPRWGVDNFVVGFAMNMNLTLTICALSDQVLLLDGIDLAA